MPKAANVTINIYSVTGELVKVLLDNVLLGQGLYDSDTAIKWDGKNGNGLKVVNGVYLINFQANIRMVPVLSRKSGNRV